jgi:hypothetical protein
MESSFGLREFSQLTQNALALTLAHGGAVSLSNLTFKTKLREIHFLDLFH